uniref:M-phase phosphoprotein 6 n=1 Tax=Eutreptiella gymnastica TaxID=73025 RepID=A0A7S4GIS1_9EUGL|mmetsp:Transcript_27926/g.47312  ORF Transcript_27926/g.47312 Transcript_27926/m.47312 type:complete len:151 (+) Transcript_27926:49-501(+)|eukprot:CAMPEP_0174288718 /NCGR_PEP_ID=MMETSP0809-20121228/21972_1 /TAXON_ID=73025 ORGANISM="Eutreptiella gymnastica-like, Strain CCMP1594" /NCGR_SAMPLE_ID=MMETSP0809 /ASSEMBLY_ACC=CAM_ASM_000658 /LENGTH=150 /DNA_ID=CAMNT_0015386133 /DNA_START=46 /DNA_END=501 /DNA_ORIENTATION=-
MADPHEPAKAKTLSGKLMNLKFMKKKQEQVLRKTLEAERIARLAEQSRWTDANADDGIVVIEDDSFNIDSQIWGRRSFLNFNPKHERGPSVVPQESAVPIKTPEETAAEKADLAWAQRYAQMQQSAGKSPFPQKKRKRDWQPHDDFDINA